MTSFCSLGTSIRIISAGETLSAVTPFLKHYDIDGYADLSPQGDGPLKVIEVFRGNPLSGYLNLGKGLNFEAALVSGYMEAIEMATVEHLPEIELHTPPLGAMVYTSGEMSVAGHVQHESTTAGMAQNGAMLRGVDLLSGQVIYAPVSDHFIPFAAPNDKISVNGLASGNSVNEARLHSLYELIERHVAAQAYRAPALCKRAELRHVPPLIQNALADLETQGFTAAFHLLGTRWGVLVWQCALLRKGVGQTLGQGDVYFGWGAHPNRTISVARALAEAVQSWATREAAQTGVLPTSRMPGGTIVSAELLHSLRGPVTAGEWQMFRLFANCSTVDFSLASDAAQGSTDPSTGLTQLLTAARAAGLKHIFTWTLSPDGRPFAVVKCVIPGFETLFEAAA